MTPDLPDDDREEMAMEEIRRDPEGLLDTLEAEMEALAESCARFAELEPEVRTVLRNVREARSMSGRQQVARIRALSDKVNEVGDKYSEALSPVMDYTDDAG